jgi:hypothetical protein
MKVYRVVGVVLYAVLTSALNKIQWSASHSARITQAETSVLIGNETDSYYTHRFYSTSKQNTQQLRQCNVEKQNDR